MKKLSFQFELPSWWRKMSTWILAFCWCFGLVLGMMAAYAASDFLIPMMRGAVEGSVSIPGLLAATVLPFLLSAFAVSLSKPGLLLIVSALKAFSFGFCACGVNLAFGSAGWLVRFLFQFSDVCLIPLLYLYWMRHISGDAGNSRWELPVCTAVAVAVGCFDYCVVSPFLVMLISF